MSLSHTMKSPLLHPHIDTAIASSIIIMYRRSSSSLLLLQKYASHPPRRARPQIRRLHPSSSPSSSSTSTTTTTHKAAPKRLFSSSPQPPSPPPPPAAEPIPPPSSSAPAPAPTPPPLPEVPLVAPPQGTSGYYKTAAVLFGITTGYLVANMTDKSLSVFWPNPNREATERGYISDNNISNWSATHSVEPRRYYEPNSLQELEQLVQEAHKKGQKIRPVGTALSPNGIGMDEEGMVCLSHLDKIKEVDKEKLTITVEAGARVSQVLEALSKEGLTLQNFSSIQEQQLGGWTQVAAHGTGARLPTVEEQIVRMKILTPTSGVLELSETQDPELFRLAKVGLGSLGIVTEVTLKCIPQHELLEQTYVVDSLKELKREHHRLLREYRHVRYMWLPHTESIVVVISNPYITPEPAAAATESSTTTITSSNDEAKDNSSPSASPPSLSKDTKLTHVRTLLHSHPLNHLSESDISSLGFTELRDALLDLAPLDPKHIAKVNAAEAEYWRLSAGWRKDESTEILGFDCGGQQWVLEVAFPIGRVPGAAVGGGGGADDANVKNNNDEKQTTGGWRGLLSSFLPFSSSSGSSTSSSHSPTPDIDFVDAIRKKIKALNLAAPCPIEQRWTASSTAPMSPAFSTDPHAVFSWVGIIMYLPPGQTPEGRKAITQAFDDYVRALEPLFDEYKAFPHWAKIEVPREKERLEKIKARLRERYPVEAFNVVRKGFDPKGILGNGKIEKLFD